MACTNPNRVTRTTEIFLKVQVSTVPDSMHSSEMPLS